MEVANQDFQPLLEVVLKKYDLCLRAKLGLQTIQNLTFDNAVEKAIANLLLTHLLKVETLAPASSDLMLEFLIKKNAYHSIVTCVKLSTNTLEKLLLTYTDMHLKEIICESLRLAGLSGKVVLMQHHSQQDIDLIELNDGSFFPNVISLLNFKNSKFLNPRVICIDGYIESVAEIHHLLEDAASIKENIFLFTRGMSDDVIHTLKVNYDRGLLGVLPFLVSYDLDGANLLNDIATVAGSDVVSSLKGQLISNIDIAKFPRVDYINLNNSGILIEKRDSIDRVINHISILQKKLLDIDSQMGKDMLSKRIKNLGSRRVGISLRDDENLAKRSFMIDRALRATKAASTHGLIEYENKFYPLSTFKVAQHYHNEFMHMFNSLGSIIVD